jgi:protease PrsW
LLHLLILVMIALAPCVLWLWIIYKKDKYAPEPLWLVIRTFLVGAGMAIPAALIEYVLLPTSLQENLTLASAAYQAFLVAGVTEEAVKFLAVRSTVYKSVHFEEPSDGLVYAAAAALGFAALENVFYLLSYGWATILVRGLSSNLGHVLFSCLWGYPLALTKLGRLKSRVWVWLGWLAAVLAHGIFDFLLMRSNGYSWLAIPFFVAMLVIFLLMFRHANKHSVYIQHRMKS